MAKILGIIGGMGPEATVDLYSKIINLSPAEKDQDHLHVIIDSYPQIPDRTAAILRGGESPVAKLTEAAIRLEKAGAEALIMPCNTAHYFLNEVASSVSIPFISIIDSTINELALLPDKPRHVTVMSTSGTKATGLYERALKKAGYKVEELSETEETDLMSCIYDGVKKGHTSEYVPLFEKTVRSLSKRADVLLAACTELPLLTAMLKGEKSNIIDPTFALAKAAVKFAC